MDPGRRACLLAMEIDLWVSKDGPERRSGQEGFEQEAPDSADTLSFDEAPVPVQAENPSPGIETAAFGPLDAVSELGWDELRESAVNCHNCDLHETRTQVVFGVGNRKAGLMVVGEAPGVDEDRQGEPFVGRAGQLLNAMLEAIGFARDQVYIANIIKCRPPGNRDPHIEETAACQPFLHRQITLLQPRLILSVGRVSAHNLLGTEESVGRLRGRVHRFDPGDIPLIVTYHPAYLLRRPLEKSKAWQDLQAVHRQLSQA